MFCTRVEEDIETYNAINYNSERLNNQINGPSSVYFFANEMTHNRWTEREKTAKEIITVRRDKLSVKIFKDCESEEMKLLSVPELISGDNRFP